MRVRVCVFELFLNPAPKSRKRFHFKHAQCTRTSMYTLFLLVKVGSKFVIFLFSFELLENEWIKIWFDFKNKNIWNLYHFKNETILSNSWLVLLTTLWRNELSFKSDSNLHTDSCVVSGKSGTKLSVPILEPFVSEMTMRCTCFMTSLISSNLASTREIWLRRIFVELTLRDSSTLDEFFSLSLKHSTESVEEFFELSSSK